MNLTSMVLGSRAQNYGRPRAIDQNINSKFPDDSTKQQKQPNFVETPAGKCYNTPRRGQKIGRTPLLLAVCRRRVWAFVHSTHFGVVLWDPNRCTTVQSTCYLRSSRNVLYLLIFYDHCCVSAIKVGDIFFLSVRKPTGLVCDTSGCIHLL